MPRGSASGKRPVTSLDGWNSSIVEDFTSPLFPDDWTIYDSDGKDHNGRGPKSADLVIVQDSVLTLRVAQLDGVWTGSGMKCNISTQTYGRYLVRARYGQGIAKAVGLLWPVVGWPPEIDFIEYESTDPNHESVFFTNHYGSDNSMQHSRLVLDSTQWHTFDLTWLPDGIRYRVDGKLIDTQTGNVPDVPMWLGLSNNLSRSGQRPDPTATPEIDWDIDWLSVFTPTDQRLQLAYDHVATA